MGFICETVLDLNLMNFNNSFYMLENIVNFFYMSLAYWKTTFITKCLGELENALSCFKTNWLIVLRLIALLL